MTLLPAGDGFPFSISSFLTLNRVRLLHFSQMDGYEIAFDVVLQSKEVDHLSAFLLDICVFLFMICQIKICYFMFWATFSPPLLICRDFCMFQILIPFYFLFCAFFSPFFLFFRFFCVYKILFLFFFFFFAFLGPHPWHMKVPRLGGQIRAVAAGLHHSHSNSGSEWHL